MDKEKIGREHFAVVFSLTIVAVDALKDKKILLEAPPPLLSLLDGAHVVHLVAVIHKHGLGEPLSQIR